MKKLVILAIGLFSAIGFAQQTHSCTQVAQLPISAVGTTQIIAAPTAPQAIHICEYDSRIRQGATSTSISLVTGTGTNCATGAAILVPAFTAFPANTIQIDKARGMGIIYSASVGTAVCALTAGGSTNALIQVRYAVY